MIKEKSVANIGLIYVARNDYAHSGIPNLYKIGLSESTRVKNRLKSLNANSSNVGEFREVGYAIVRNIKHVESEVFLALNEYRVQPNREFFDCNIKVIFKTIIEIAGDRILDSVIPSNVIDSLTLSDLPKQNLVAYKSEKDQRNSYVSSSRNFDIMDHWLLDFLQLTDDQFNENLASPMNFSSSIPKQQIFDNFINYKQRLGDYSTIHPVKFWKKMHSYKKIFVLGSYSRKLEGKRERMINISARGDSRKIFENFHNLEFHWD